MKSIRQLRIGLRLNLAFGLLAGLLALTGAMSLFQLNWMNHQILALTDDWLPSVAALGEINAGVNSARRLTLRHALEAEPDTKANTQRKRDELVKNTIPAQLAAYEALLSSTEEKALKRQLDAQWIDYVAVDDTVLAASNRPDMAHAELARLAVGESTQRFAKLQSTLAQMTTLNKTGATQARAQTLQAHAESRWLIVSVLGATLLLTTAMAWLITRSITTPLQASVQLAERVASGDLTARLPDHGRDEVNVLNQALTRMTESLAQLVQQVRQSSDSIATGAGEIASGNADLSQRTEEQAANLEETAASMEELNATVKASADTALQVAQLATSASSSATQGGQVVGQVVATMEEITTSSRKIADIIGTIDGIAFQTNILALNAAVEAARAGEQGRGFAVVASEVRSLAQRSADAARQIKHLISTSVEKVETGSRLVGAAGGQMTDIVRQVQRVTDLISEISAAAQEQTAGIGQVNTAVTQLDQVTQQNAALVEQSAAAADSLQQQARTLVGLVGAFRLQ